MSVPEKEQKLKELLADHKDMIYRLCYAYLHNKEDIEDLFQEITINIWNHLDQFRGASKISTWIYRIVVNSALMYNKKDKKRKTFFSNIDIEPPIAPIDEADDYFEKEKRIEQLNAAINQLKKQDRLIISLVLEGVKYEEIADIMGMTMSYVGVKINRIKTTLFNLLQENSNG